MEEKAPSKSPRKTVIVILAAILVLSLAAWAGSNLVHARNTRASNACVLQLRMIDGAKQQWAYDTRATSNATPSWMEMEPYLKDGAAQRECPSGGNYKLGSVAEAPSCSTGGPDHTLDYNFEREHRPNWISGGTAALSALGLLAMWLLGRRKSA